MQHRGDERAQAGEQLWARGFVSEWAGAPAAVSAAHRVCGLAVWERELIHQAPPPVCSPPLEAALKRVLHGSCSENFVCGKKQG